MSLPCRILPRILPSINNGSFIHFFPSAAGKISHRPPSTLQTSEDSAPHIMTQRQLFHSLLILFSILIFIDGFRLFIEIHPKLVPSFADSLYAFSKKGGWPLPSVSYILPPLLPSLTTLGLASLVFYKAGDLQLGSSRKVPIHLCSFTFNQKNGYAGA